MSETLARRPEEVDHLVRRASRARTWRRIGASTLLLVVVGAVTGLYGPRTAQERSATSWGELEVSHPRVVRAGTDLTVSVTPRPARTGDGYTLLLGLGWVEELGIEVVTPVPTSESTSGDAWLLTFDEHPGETVVLSGRVPTHPRVGPVDTPVGIAPAGERSPAAELDLTTWVLP